MSDTSLIFNLLAIDSVSNILGNVGSGFDRLAIAVGAAAVDAGSKMISMAGDFQQGITRLQTGAGESADNLAMVSQGILDMAGKVGETVPDLLEGMRLIESAGFHGADGLKVLQDSAEGARVGVADMATVADAVTTGLNAYHLSAGKATQVINALIAADGQGKTSLQEMSASLSTVAPAASIAGISLNEILGALSTMTAMGTDSANAATYLRQTILQLSNPTPKARTEMEALGLSAIQVSQNLGKNGLAATLTELTDAIQAHMGPAGTVLIEKLKGAAGNANTFQQILAGLPATQQTYIGALADMVGGTKSMQAALELTGPSMQTFQHNTDIINGKVAEGGSTIDNWSTVQGNFNTQMAEAKGKMEAVGIEIGTMLMPKALQLTNAVSGLVGWFIQHKQITQDLGIAIGVAAGAFLAYKTAVIGYQVVTTGIAIATKVWTAAQWLLNVAMDANPIGLIIIGIVALIVIIVLLWNHSAAFRDFFIGIWHGIADVALWLWHNIIEPVFHGIADVVMFFVRIWVSEFNLIKWIVENTIGVAIMWLWHTVFEPAFHGIADVATWLWHEIIEPVFNGIGAVIKWVWDHVISPTWNAIHDAAVWLGGKLGDIFGSIGGAIGTAFSTVGGIVKGVFNDVIRLINDAIGGVNSLIDKANKVPGVSFPHLPTLPLLADGGTAMTSGLAVVGEKGAEVVRLGAGDTVYPHGSGPGGAGGGQDIRVWFDIPAGQDHDIDRVLVRRLREFVRVGYGGNVQSALGRVGR